jgi:type III secretory pathway component EscV
MGDDRDQRGDRDARIVVLGIALPVLLVGAALALVPGWPVVVVGALAIVVMALTAARLAAERDDEPGGSPA